VERSRLFGSSEGSEGGREMLIDSAFVMGWVKGAGEDDSFDRCDFCRRDELDEVSLREGSTGDRGGMGERARKDCSELNSKEEEGDEVRTFFEGRASS